MRGLPLSKHKVLFNASCTSLLLLCFLKSSHLPHFWSVKAVVTVHSESILSRQLPFSFFSSFSVWPDSQLSPVLNWASLCCGKLDGLKAWDGQSFALFTLGCISIKLTRSLLLPSITNSVCLCRVHFPLQLQPLFVTVNKWLLFIPLPYFH